MTSFILRHQGKFLILFILLGFLLRYHGIDRFGIAGDEKYSLFVSQFTSYQGNNQKDSVRKPNSPYFTAKEFWSKKDIIDFYDAIARVDTGNGAFFTYLLHWWSLWFGVSDTSLRMIPLFFSLFLIPLIFVFVKRHLKDDLTAIISAALASISPFLISYAQVARNYAVLFFFALLATHYFLCSLKETSYKKWMYVILYGLAAAICELNHLSTFPLFFIHFGFLMVYYRTWKNFVSFCLSMAFPFAAIILWLSSPGGAFLFDYVENSVKVYTSMATQSPHEFLSLTSIKTIVFQIRHVFSAMFISIDGFYDGVSSKKDGLVGLIFLFLGFGVFFTGKLSHLSKMITYAVLAGIALFVTEFRSWFLPIYFVNLTLTLYALVTIWRNEVNRKALFRLLVSLSVLPVLFLILFAIQDGNTFRIITRYAGYGYSFALILVVWLYRWLLENKRELKPVILVTILAQAVQVVFLISRIYEDQQPRYFMDYAQPREANPYPLIAAKIEEMAAPGDTVVFPSDSYVQNGNEAYYSVIDAQLTNFYLAKDNVVYQRIDPKEQNKVLLKSPDGSVVELFDFQGNKYRY